DQSYSKVMLSSNLNLTIVLLISISSIIIASHAQSSTKTTIEIEIEALKAFKKSITHDPNKILANWIDTHPHCNWSGIECNNSSNHVISISLPELQLQGEISPFLGNFSNLQLLDLSSNSFTGQIPIQITLCTQLTSLYLVENSLSGSIPCELSNLKMLQYLDLGDNFFNGTLPDCLFEITSLLGIAFNFNNLTGRIP
ncbi:hypothetical protein KIW84_072337, partial [Lathyrus oleraceus]